MSSLILILFIFACVFVYAIGGSDIAITYGVSDSHLWNCLFYQFLHASWLHLGLNMFAIGYMLPAIGKLWERKFNNTAYSSILLLAAGYVSSAIAGAACACSTPTVGASGIAFFLLGVLLVLNPTWRQVRNYLWIAAAVAVQIYFGKSNTALHITCFTFGALYTVFHEFKRQYRENVDRGISEY